jgi:hypothetical protein
VDKTLYQHANKGALEMKTVERTNSEDLDPGPSPELMKEIVNLLGQTWQQNLLKELRRGPGKPPTYAEVLLDVDNEEACITIEGCLDDAVMESLIEDLEEQGFVTRDDNGILTGLGQYAEVALTEIEKDVLAAMKRCKGPTITPVGVRRKLKGVRISTGQVQVVLDELARKGYVKEEEVIMINPLSTAFCK